MDSAAQLIEQLGLAPHPEGGWYRETWRGAASAAGNGAASAAGNGAASAAGNGAASVAGNGAASAAGRGAAGPDGRAQGTAILFLLRAGEASHWHTVDATELWLWQAGDPLELRLAAGGAGPVRSLILGADIAAGQSLQGLVDPHEWQAARPYGAPVHGYSLVTCVVVPGFDFAGFTLAAPRWEPGA